MSSLLEYSSRLAELPPPESSEGKHRLLTLYPVKTPGGQGWIGLHDGKIAWLSLGPLDRDGVQQYWNGPLKEARRCPFSPENLDRLTQGHGDHELAPLGTSFQKAVWEQLLRIPFSSTRTYRQIAEELGSPNRARAVGTAIGANPIAWLIPCHRVVPSKGGLGGYRWGTPIKEKLLGWEQSRKGLIKPHDRIPDEREKLEAVLLRAQRFEDIAKLAGDIAHDLNNLLAPIRMSTELLKRKLTDSSVDRYVDIIESSTARARSVIQEILSFSRETEDHHPEPIDVIPVLRELEQMVRTSFPGRIKVKFLFERPSARVKVDPSQLHRCLLNILVNAKDAIRDKGLITLKTSAQELGFRVCVGGRSLEPGHFLCISITDTGCGIPEAIREQIFDPFFTTKPKEEGTGLGLASAYGIIARSGGFMDVESAIGKGSTFDLFFPYTED